MPNVIFRYGTSQQYNELEKRDASALYFLEDKKEIRKGDDLYAVGRAATQAEDGLMSAADKAKLDGLAEGTGGMELTPVDGSIIIAPGEQGIRNIKVGISAEEGNILSVKDDGLFVDMSGLTGEMQSVAEEVANEAINEFANKVSDDGTVNTIKELVDYVAQHGPEAAGMTADIAGLQKVIGSLPDEFMSEITAVERTETMNVAQIRLSVKQPDGTYSTSDRHGVLTLIGAGQGVDGKQGAGLMTLADKQKLDSIDPEVIDALSAALVWGTI